MSPYRSPGYVEHDLPEEPKPKTAPRLIPKKPKIKPICILCLFNDKFEKIVYMDEDPIRLEHYCLRCRTKVSIKSNGYYEYRLPK